MELIGKFKLAYDEKSFASGFTVREFVVTTEEQYPNDILFVLQKEKTAFINGVNPGERLKLSFDIRGKEYNGRYYNNLVVWKVENLTNAPQASSPQNAPAPPPTLDDFPPSSGDDDLPF